ncbi:MAG: hypothetical protein IJY93_04140 [Clostridia bacterium]|nr:hypothetical protein [Clostridia bacterium]
MRKTISISMAIALICSLLMTITIFLPYATATEEHSERLKSNSSFYSLEDVNMDGNDLVNISMTDYAKIYSTMSQKMFGNSSAGVMYVVLVVLIAIFSAIALLFSILKKPIAIIIFDILAFLTFYIQNWDYTDRGIIPSSNYDWGIAYYIFIVAAVALLANSVWMLIIKIKNKKSAIAFNM